LRLPSWQNPVTVAFGHEVGQVVIFAGARLNSGAKVCCAVWWALLAASSVELRRQRREALWRRQRAAFPGLLVAVSAVGLDFLQCGTAEES
jgi:hypothetical protein